MVGYSLGNKVNPEDKGDLVTVLEEDEPNVITYSKSTRIPLYGYKEKKYSRLNIPYKTIKHAKQSRQNGIREVIYDVFHRPDASSLLRSMLNLWGFDSYVNYLYTICELGFLEGLIPVIDLGFLTPDEIKSLYEVAAVIRCPLYSDYDLLMEKDGIRTREKSLEIHEKVFTWASKLKFPTVTGFFVHEGQDLKQIKEWANLIAETAETYGVVHEVVIHRNARTSEVEYKPLSIERCKAIYKTVRDIIPDSIPVVIEDPNKELLELVLDRNETDLGSFSDTFLESEEGQQFWTDLVEVAESRGLELKQRFPIRKAFIKEQRYSKKLGQVFDSYKYKIKRHNWKNKRRQNKQMQISSGAELGNNTNDLVTSFAQFVANMPFDDVLDKEKANPKKPAIIQVDDHRYEVVDDSDTKAKEPARPSIPKREIKITESSANNADSVEDVKPQDAEPQTRAVPQLLQVNVTPIQPERFLQQLPKNLSAFINEVADIVKRYNTQLNTFEYDFRFANLDLEVSISRKDQMHILIQIGGEELQKEFTQDRQDLMKTYLQDKLGDDTLDVQFEFNDFSAQDQESDQQEQQQSQEESVVQDENAQSNEDT